MRADKYMTTKIKRVRGEYSHLMSGQGTIIRDLIRIIDEGALDIALIVDGNKRLKGVVSDGDVRRAFLAGYGFDTPAKDIMVKNFCFADQRSTRNERLSIMRESSIIQLPILDELGKIVDLELLEAQSRSHTRHNNIFIMAGGKGTRMGNLTANCPKPMLSVFGKPILQGIIEACKSNGFYKFTLSVNYLKEIIQDYFRDGSQFDVSIEYVVENEPLGTCGSLSLLDNKDIEPIVVVNGDLFTSVNFALLVDFHESHNADLTMCVKKKNVCVEYAVVEVKGNNFEGLVEKPSYEYLVNTGIYVLGPKAVGLIPKAQRFDMTDLIELCKSDALSVKIFFVHEDWVDIGNPEIINNFDRWSKNC